MCNFKKPAWWQLYAIVTGAAVLLWWEGRARLAEPLDEIALVAIVVLVHGLVAWWLYASQTGIEREDLDRQARARGQAQARPAPVKQPAHALSPTPVQAHYRWVMGAGKHESS